MFEALLHGKLSREKENMEDLLTSMIFGTFEGEPLALLERFLATAVTLDGTRPFASLPALSSAAYEFWPWLAEEGCNPCEPDVLLRLAHVDGTTTDVLVEVKFRSGKSSLEGDPSTDEPEARSTTPEAMAADPGPASEAPPWDQLAREWSNLERHSTATRRWVLYATASLVRPEKDLTESLHVLHGRGNLCWAPLTRVHELLRTSADQSHATRKLALALERLGLVGFEGIPVLDHPLTWRFIAAKRVFPWATIPPPTWRYSAVPLRWEWEQFPASRIPWSFR